MHVYLYIKRLSAKTDIGNKNSLINNWPKNITVHFRNLREDKDCAEKDPAFSFFASN